MGLMQEVAKNRILKKLRKKEPEPKWSNSGLYELMNGGVSVGQAVAAMTRWGETVQVKIPVPQPETAIQTELIRLIQMANIRFGQRIVIPSAGNGEILDLIRNVTGKPIFDSLEIVCFDDRPECRNSLHGKCNEINCDPENHQEKKNFHSVFDYHGCCEFDHVIFVTKTDERPSYNWTGEWGLGFLNNTIFPMFGKKDQFRFSALISSTCDWQSRPKLKEPILAGVGHGGGSIRLKQNVDGHEYDIISSLIRRK